LKQISATISSNTEILSGIHQMTIEVPEIAALAKPGQFVMVSCGEQLLLNRPLSIHRVYNRTQISFLYSTIGQGTSNLSRMEKQETIKLIGPLGNNFSIDECARNVLLIAGGMGIAPLIFLIEYAVTLGKSVTLLIGASSSSKVYPKSLLPHVDRLSITTEDGSEGIKCLVTGLLSDHIDNADQVFACGPVAMYKTIARIMNSREPEKPVQVSMEVRMGCGMGLCYGCSIKTENGMRLVCHDGPVFTLDEIFWKDRTLCQ
jgi:dihydroorotate dehydrogenase electron transfer subunit